MFTEYPKVLSFFKQAIHTPNLELKDIVLRFASMKAKDEIGAARFLIKEYHSYQNHIAQLTANASVK